MKKMLEVKDLNISFHTFAGEVKAIRGVKTLNYLREKHLQLLENLVPENQLPLNQL